MAGSNLAAVLYKEKDIRIENRPIPEPGRNEVQIRMRAIAVCATDVHRWEHGSIGDVKLEKPVILGHECSGVVSKLGQGVNNVNVGDRVAIEPLKVCRRCDACVSGRYNLCPDICILSKPPDDGGLIQYLVHESDFVYKVPDTMSFEEAALIEPFSVGLHACGLAKVTVADSVLISGAGPVGICALLAAQAFGATTIAMTDLDQSRLEFARKMGATHTFQIQKSSSVDEIARNINDKIGRPLSKAIECSGTESAVHLAVEVLQEGGVVSLVGFGKPSISIPVATIILKEIKLIGSKAYRGRYRAAVELISSGRCSLAPLVTHHFTLQETQRALEMCHSRTGFRGVIDCNPE